MEVDELLSLLARRLAAGAGTGAPLPRTLVVSAAEVLGCDGGAVTFAYTRPERVTLVVSDDTALILEEAQDVTAQGPGPDAFTTGEYQRLDLTGRGTPDSRWPLLSFDSVPQLAPIVLHAIPLVINASVIGVLSLYQRGLDREIDVESADVIARAVAAALLADPPAESDFQHGMWSERAEVHQATGMVVAQLGIPERDALALIRAHAYCHDQSVAKTARAVVTLQLQFSGSPQQEIEST